MDDFALVSFPLPMLTALLCGALAALVWRLELGVVRANAMFSGFFALGAIMTFLVGLRFGYGVEAFVPLQRILPLFLGPVMYLGFAATTVDTGDFAKTAVLHLVAPVVVVALFWLFAQNLRWLDWVISASYLIYVCALYSLWRKGPDAFVHARVDVSRSLSNWILRAIGFVVFILLLDSAISLDFAITGGANSARLISFGTFPLIVVLLTSLVALPLVFSRSGTRSPSVLMPDAETEEVTARLEELMNAHRLYLDPELSVQRLAKRLHLPARTLSASINATQGVNMSQHVNTFRLAHAARLLVTTDESVTRIAAQSGFLARSNFYREFQRIYRQSPTDYRASRRRE